MNIPGVEKIRVVLFGDDSKEMSCIYDSLRHVGPNAECMGPGYRRYSIHKSTDYQSALQIFAAAHPDVVFLDRNNKNSLDLCRRIREVEGIRHTGLIFFGIEGEGVTNVEGLDAGGDDVISMSMGYREVLARVNAVVRLKVLADRLRQANHRLETLSLVDDLTGLQNMRSFFESYKNLLEKCANKSCGLAIYMMDLDHFKSVNDGSNHLVGSFVLSEVGRLLRLSNVFGSESVLARYGGDEFIVAAPYLDLDSASASGNQFRLLISDAEFVFEEFHITLTCSMGLCFARPGFKVDGNNLIKLADLLLYQSKESGRNRLTAREVLEDDQSVVNRSSRICQELDRAPVFLGKKKII